MDIRLLRLLLSAVAAFVTGLCDFDAMGAAPVGSERGLSKETYVYKTVDEVRIHADVYRPQDAVKQPMIVWLHGGALIMGSRQGVPTQLRELSQKEGLVLVSLDYRLAPEVKLPEIIEDLKDGLQWVRESGPELFDANPSRMVVAGASAGGYLAMMSGFVIEPPPTALVAYWGFGDIDGDWTTKPNEHYRKWKLIAEKDAWAAVGKQVLSGTDHSNGRARSMFFTYLKQHGLWTKTISGIDPETDAPHGLHCAMLSRRRGRGK